MKRFFWILAAPVLAGAQVASADLTAPTLGYALDGESKSLRAIEGVPGAAAVGHAIHVGASLDSIAVAPNRRYAIGSNESGVLLINLDGASGIARQARIPSASAFFSPSGETAAFAAGERVEVYGGLPDQPELARSFELGALAENLEKLAVSDDGRRVVAIAGGSLWRLREDGAAEEIAAGYRDAGFLRQTQDLIALSASGDRLVLLRKAEADSLEELAGAAEGLNGAIGFALSADERFIAVRNEGSALLLLNRDTRTAVRLNLEDAKADGLWRTEGNAVFQLHRDASNDIWLLDGDADTPRLTAVMKKGDQ